MDMKSTAGLTVGELVPVCPAKRRACGHLEDETIDRHEGVLRTLLVPGTVCQNELSAPCAKTSRAKVQGGRPLPLPRHPTRHRPG